VRKDTRAKLFRDRLSSALKAKDLSRSALARKIGYDRSTITQLLNGDEARLPNVDLAACCAEVLGVSSDWLLGLSDFQERAADLLSASFEFKKAARTPADEFIQECHRKAASYKIRYVPTSLPDALKTEAVLEYEYRAFLGKTPKQAIVSMQDALEHIRAPDSDIEICSRLDIILNFARGDGYWDKLPLKTRQEQLRHIIKTCEEFYPSLRLYLFDAKKIYSSPIAIYGPVLGTIYVGQFYMVLRRREQLRALNKHFDQLVRLAEVDARSVGSWIEKHCLN